MNVLVQKDTITPTAQIKPVLKVEKNIVFSMSYHKCSGVSGGSKGGAPGAPHPSDQNFLNFMQFFGNLGKNYMLAPPLEGWRPLLRKSWIRPWECTIPKWSRVKVQQI